MSGSLKIPHNRLRQIKSGNMVPTLVIFVLLTLSSCGASSASYSVSRPPIQPTTTPTLHPSVHTISQSSDFSYDLDSSTVFQPGEMTQACPAHEIAIGGGFMFDQSFSSGHASVFITESLPFSGGWKIGFDHVQAVTATIFTQCLRGAAAAVTIKQSADIDMPAQTPNKSVALLCATGSIILGGGFSVKTGIAMISNSPAGSTDWEGNFKNNAQADVIAGASLYAVCYASSPPVLTTRDHRIQTGSGLYGVNTAMTTTACQPGMTLTAGGYTNTNSESLAYTDTPNAQGTEWQVRLIRLNTSVDVTGLTAVIECVQF